MDMEEQDQVSMVVEDYDDDEEVFSGDSGSSVTDEASDDHGLFVHFTRNGMIKMDEETEEYESIKNQFLTGMRQYAYETEVVAIHKNLCSTFAMQARCAAFRSYELAVLQKSGGRRRDTMVNYGWFGASKEEISQIISYGFSQYNGQSHGVGVYLSPTKFLLDGLASSSADENGMRYMLLCHLIMGKMEVIPAGSKQICPSSVEFDSGVDNLEAPRRLIVWGAFMNFCIFPAYIISFRAPSFDGSLRNRFNELKRNHSSLSFAALFPILVQVLGPAKGTLIAKSVDNFRKQKITRMQLTGSLKQIIGDGQLLTAIIKSNMHKLVVRGSSSNGGSK